MSMLILITHKFDSVFMQTSKQFSQGEDEK